MSGFNLPPGVSVNDIPGNTPADVHWENLYEDIERIADKYGFEVDDIRDIFILGLSIFVGHGQAQQIMDERE